MENISDMLERIVVLLERFRRKTPNRPFVSGCAPGCFRMLIPKRNRVQIYEYLFKEGVLVAEKKFQMKHPQTDLPNLQVVNACKSLASRGYVKKTKVWQHFYFTLTNEGIQYLREFLHLPPEIVPATLKRQNRPMDSRARPKVDEPRRAYSNTGDRDSYRRAGQAGGDRGPDKKAEAGAGTATFEFRGGFGRGRGAP